MTVVAAPATMVQRATLAAPATNKGGPITGKGQELEQVLVFADEPLYSTIPSSEAQ